MVSNIGRSSSFENYPLKKDDDSVKKTKDGWQVIKNHKWIIAGCGALACLAISTIAGIFFNQEPYEEEIEKYFGREALTFNASDPKPKLLYLQSKYDNNQAFKPEIYKDQFQSLIDSYDIRYKVIKKASEVCTEIATAAKVAPKTIIIAAHGKPGVMTFSESLSPSSKLDLKGTVAFNFAKYGWDEHCFSALHPDSEIILHSCETGAKKNGIASELARVAKRTVWSPKTVFSPSGVLLNTNDISLKLKFLSVDVIYDEHTLKPIHYVPKNPSDITCKSLPDGTHTCGPQTQSWPSWELQ